MVLPSAGVVVTVAGISKRFGTGWALRSVGLGLEPGRVHMLLGENGAGKSTLVNILLGVLVPDEGAVQVNGTGLRRHSPAEARRLGINAVLQELSLAPSLSVWENLFLGREMTRKGRVLDRAEMKLRARETLRRLGIDVSITRRIDDLELGERQLVEIAKAVMGERGVILFDEPTASLSGGETEKLFEIIAHLQSEGWATMYITHRMEEVRRLGDDVTVLRDGVVTLQDQLDAVGDHALLRAMVGRDLGQLYSDVAKEHSADGEKVLEVRDLSTLDRRVRNCTLQVRRGEVVSIAGLVGCGKSELLAAIFGYVPAGIGELRLEGNAISKPEPGEMLVAGVVLVPGDRRVHGVALRLSVEVNINLEVFRAQPFVKYGVMNRTRLRQNAEKLVQKLQISPPRISEIVEALSGGNQQKVVFARAVCRARALYLLDEPTSGVDVGAREQIYRLIDGLVESGAAILLASSDLQEVVNLSHRVYVMHRGEIVSELAGEEIKAEAVLRAAFGGNEGKQVNRQIEASASGA